MFADSSSLWQVWRLSVAASEVSCDGGWEDGGGEVGFSVVANVRAVGVDVESGIGVEWEMGVNSGVEVG